MNRKARRSKKNRMPTKRFFKTSLVTFGALLATQIVMAPRTFATDFNVTNCTDTDDSLRDAVTSTATVIRFAPDLNCSLITLSTDLPQINRPLEIIGPGADKLTINFSTGTTKGFDFIHTSTFKISGLQIKGKGIVSSGDLEIDSVDFQNIVVGTSEYLIEGKGVDKEVKVYNSTIGGVSIVDYAINSKGSIEVDNSTFVGNVFQEGVLITSTSTGTISISNSTFVDNDFDGYNAGQPDFDNWYGASLKLFGNIFANNDFHDPYYENTCAVAPALSKENLFNVAYTGCESDVLPNRIISDLRSSLANLPALNSGITPTVALLSGSPAIDFYTTGSYTTLDGLRTRDQRGLSRPFGSGYDVGAFEYRVAPSSSGDNSSPSSTCVTKTLGSIGFKANSDKLSKATKLSLDNYADSILKSGCKTVIINGHTAKATKTTKAVSKYRELLANRRALAVESYLKAALNKYDSKVIFKTNALGAKSPVASNKNESGRKPNRRVEIIIN